MTVFVDTSGFYAFLDPTDAHHKAAVDLFGRALSEGWKLVTTNYVVHEAWALLQTRLGWEALDGWSSRLLTLCSIIWVDRQLHTLATERCQQARERGLSLTDCVSLSYMRQVGIRHAIAFDRHFVREGIVRP